MESVEADQEESYGVQGQAQAVVERVASGQQGPGLELRQSQLHLSSPFQFLERSCFEA